MTFGSVTVPSGLESFVEIEGTGSEGIVVTISPSMPQQTDLTLTITYEISGTTSTTIGVLDQYHHDDDDWINNYFIEKP